MMMTCQAQNILLLIFEISRQGTLAICCKANEIVVTNSSLRLMGK